MLYAEALRIIAAGKGTHFDPVLARVFLAINGQIREIAEQFPDETISG